MSLYIKGHKGRGCGDCYDDACLDGCVEIRDGVTGRKHMSSKRITSLANPSNSLFIVTYSNASGGTDVQVVEWNGAGYTYSSITYGVIGYGQVIRVKNDGSKFALIVSDSIALFSVNTSTLVISKTMSLTALPTSYHLTATAGFMSDGVIAAAFGTNRTFAGIDKYSSGIKVGTVNAGGTSISYGSTLHGNAIHLTVGGSRSIYIESDGGGGSIVRIATPSSDSYDGFTTAGPSWSSTRLQTVYKKSVSGSGDDGCLFATTAVTQNTVEYFDSSSNGTDNTSPILGYPLCVDLLDASNGLMGFDNGAEEVEILSGSVSTGEFYPSDLYISSVTCHNATDAIFTGSHYENNGIYSTYCCLVV